MEQQKEQHSFSSSLFTPLGPPESVVRVLLYSKWAPFCPSIQTQKKSLPKSERLVPLALPLATLNPQSGGLVSMLGSCSRGQVRTANLGMTLRPGQVLANLGMTISTYCRRYITHSVSVCPSERTCSPLTRLLLLGSSFHPHQEGPGRDDFRTQATEVLPGDAGWEIGGPEPEAGGTAGKNQPPRPQR